jgi:predicted component of type VI protein secretion system
MASTQTVPRASRLILDAATAADLMTPNPMSIRAEATDRPRTREDAFRDLLEIADFFRRTEPHTVVSYALEQIVRWGRMSLPELLAELIPEEPSRKNLFKQVGIKSPEPPGKGDSAKESKK